MGDLQKVEVLHVWVLVLINDCANWFNSASKPELGKLDESGMG